MDFKRFVNHEEDVEGQVDLLQSILVPRDTLLHSVIAGSGKIQSCDRMDENEIMDLIGNE